MLALTNFQVLAPLLLNEDKKQKIKEHKKRILDEYEKALKLPRKAKKKTKKKLSDQYDTLCWMERYEKSLLIFEPLNFNFQTWKETN